jgi:hypothetical protein
MRVSEANCTLTTIRPAEQPGNRDGCGVIRTAHLEIVIPFPGCPKQAILHLPGLARGRSRPGPTSGPRPLRRPSDGNPPELVIAFLGPGIGSHQLGKHPGQLRGNGWLGCLLGVLGYPGMGRPAVLGDGKRECIGMAIWHGPGGCRTLGPGLPRRIPEPIKWALDSGTPGVVVYPRLKGKPDPNRRQQPR